MKKMIGVGIAVAVLLCSSLTYAECEFSIGFDVILSGKAIDDGFFISGFMTDVLFFDICTTATGLTTDSFTGLLHDPTVDFWQVSGTIVWNPTFTVGYIQGTNRDVTSPYIDGIIKFSRGIYTLSAKGGNSDGFSFIEIYNSIKGPGNVLPTGQGQTEDTGKRRRDKLQSSDNVRIHRVSKYKEESSSERN